MRPVHAKRMQIAVSGTLPMADGSKRVLKLRCAIYTRKSSEEGLDQEFNSLQAQREACEAFITSQKGEGWQTLPRITTTEVGPEARLTVQP